MFGNQKKKKIDQLKSKMLTLVMNHYDMNDLSRIGKEVSHQCSCLPKLSISENEKMTNL